MRLHVARGAFRPRFLAFSAILACTTSVALAQTPVPAVTGPIPVTENSYPALAIDREP